MTITFVGTVVGGTFVNTLNPGLNLVSSIFPASGDLSSNSLMAFPSLAGGQFDGDQLFLYFNSGNGNSGYTQLVQSIRSITIRSWNYGWDGVEPGQPDPILTYAQAASGIGREMGRSNGRKLTI